ncbi:methylated-DNA--[protein]-cysteine S-methyltransferase [Paucidesulfovibrio longus]|uniref:methylated-DNA--[protein]-cysteine S-methyltransferase n=1 Tax=Paucidesulfovibrio longus TaxID=889 RepID=UPI0003B4A12A|nr:MGMT family protein [Paucidesulfovibrio longus]
MSAKRHRIERTESVEAGKLRLTLVHDADKISGIELSWATGAGPDPDLSPLGSAVQAALERYVRGEEPRWPDLPLDWNSLSPFTARVLRTLAEKVPQGRTASYGELARMADSPNGARATGRALGANPWPLVVPCHRVVAANGALTGFTNPCGLEMKAYLLDLEARASERA